MAKLLLVEDDNNLREIYEARLTAEGYDITTAQNGEEALSVAKDVHPDLIISDVMMPRISGFEMLDILRNTDELKNTKIIMLTALGQAEDRGRADNLGADKYLVKSQVTLEDIVKAAQELLGSNTAEPVEAAPAETPAPEMTQPAQTASVPVSEPTPVMASPVTSDPLTEVAPVVTPPASPAVPVTEPVTETPVAAAPPVSEPVSVPAPVVTPDPVAPAPAVSVPDPIAAVTVADPDPITVTPVQDSSQPAPVVTTPMQTVQPTTSIPNEGQTLEAEEAAIKQQIASFAEAPAPVAAQDNVSETPAVVAPTPPAATATANDAVLAQAVSELTAASAPTPEPAAPTTEPVPAPTPAPELPPAPAPTAPADSVDEDATASQQVSGRKVIQPLGEESTSAPDLQALLAAEDAKESAPTDSSAPQASPAPIEPAKPAIDPNTIAL